MGRMYATMAMVVGVALMVMVASGRHVGPVAAAVQVAALLALAGGLAVCVLVVTRKTQWDAVPEVVPIIATVGWESDRAFKSPNGGLIGAYDPDYLIDAAPPAPVVRTVESHGAYADAYSAATASPVSTYDPDSLIGGPVPAYCMVRSAAPVAPPVSAADTKLAKRRAAAQKGLATKAAKRAAREAIKATA